MLRRELTGAYLLVGGGLVIGLLIGGLVVDASPQIVGWVFGGGAGVTAGAFIAAITSDEPLIGSGSPPRGTGPSGGSPDETEAPPDDASEPNRGNGR